MSTRTEQVLARKAAIEEEKRRSLENHLAHNHEHAPELASQVQQEKAKHAAEMSARATEALRRKSLQEDEAVSRTLKSLEEREKNSRILAEHHKAEVAQHAHETGMHPASLEGVRKKEMEEEQRRLELEDEIRKKGEQAERLRRKSLEDVKEKARAFEKPFEH